MTKIVKVVDYFLVCSIGLSLLTFTSGENNVFIPFLNLFLPGLHQLVGLSFLLLVLRLGIRFEPFRTAIGSFAVSLYKNRVFTYISQKDIVCISLSRPLLLIVYFFTNKFFLYRWDDQHGYFAVAQGLVNFDPIVERFTFGLPVLLVPFIKIFHAQEYTDLVLPFSIFNAFLLGTLNIYFLFKIAQLLSGNRNVARVAAIVYVLYPFLPFLAQTGRNSLLREQVSFGDMVGWNMTSDHIGVVFLLLAVFLFLRSLEKQKSLFLPGIALGYAGLIRMPNLMILVPLCYLAFLKHRKIKEYLVFFFALFLVLSPQLAYNWYFFGSPFRFGYTALGHLSGFWSLDIFLDDQDLMLIINNHYLLLVGFLLALFVRSHRRTGIFLLLWAFLFTGYYSGYEMFFKNPVRFILALSPALCIGIGTLITLGKNSLERVFFCGSILLLVVFTSYSHIIFFIDPLPAPALLSICLVLIIVGFYLGVSAHVSLAIYVYALIYLYLSRGFGHAILLAFLCLLFNIMPGKWTSFFSRFNPQKSGFFQRRLSPLTIREIIGLWATSYRKQSIIVLCLLIGTIWVFFAKTKDVPGLEGHYYANPNWEGQPVLSRIERRPYSVRWDGWVALPKSGTYKFAINSNSDAYLRIDGRLIAAIRNAHEMERDSNEIELKGGVYPIEIAYSQTGDFRIFQTFWKPPGKREESLIPPEALFTERPQWTGILFRRSTPILTDILKVIWGSIFLFMSILLIMFIISHKTFPTILKRVELWFSAKGRALLCFKSYRKHSVVFLCLLIGGSLWGFFSQNTWGLKGQYYTNTNWEGEPAVSKMDKMPHLKGETGYNLLSTNTYSVRWKGWISISESGTYRFATNSDDGSYLRINGETVVRNGGAHGLRKVSQEIELEKGMYPIEVLYFQTGGFSKIQTLWTPPGKSEHLIPPEVLFPEQSDRKDIMLRKSMTMLLKILKITWEGVLLFVSLIFLTIPVKP